jgi:NAD(P)-dependent dehydrogenase (short-subunit alcohol dehydrogenase family)
LEKTSQRLSGRIALVTGGASGIGRAVATRFAAEGATVWIADRNRKGASEAASTLDNAERFIALDVTSEEGWRHAVAEVTGRDGRLDILVNAAGISTLGRPQDPEAVSIEDWRAVNAVNVEGTVLGCKAAMATMKRTGGGAIVNLASIVAIRSSPALSAYGASKAAVRQFTSSVAAHCALKGYGIRCNMVLPGMIDTPLVSGMTPDYREAWEETIPMHRYGTAEEVAAAVAFLASDEAAYVTGTGLTIDGGTTTRPPLWRE